MATKRALSLVLAVGSVCLTSCGQQSSPGVTGERQSTATSVAEAKPLVVSLNFDDGVIDDVNFAQMLEQRGLRGTFYIISGQIGYSASMSVAQIQALQAAGHEIGGHTLTHPHLPVISLGDAQRQICNDRANLMVQGLNVQTLAYPYGEYNANVEAAAKTCGYDAARRVGPLDDGGSDPITETIPPADPYAIQTLWSVESTFPLAQMEGWINDASAVGGWTTVVFHHLCDTGSCDQYSISSANFTALLDYILAQPNITVKLTREVTGGSVQPIVWLPNPILNPSLESDVGPADGMPDYWEKTYGWGRNSESWRRVAGHTGSYAERVDVSSFLNGLVLFSPIVDQCTPPVIPGHVYTLSAWYKSSAQPLWTLYYKDQNGNWNDFATSPALPASSNWAATSFTTPPIPAGAASLNFGLGLVSTGYLVMDDFALTDTTNTQLAATTSALSASPNPATVGQSVTLTATVTSASGTPTGTVNFMDGTTTLGTGTLDGSGVATYATSGLATGTHSLTAAYGGGANFSSSTSPPVNEVVNSLPATTTALSATPNPATSGQPVTLTATVTSSAGTPTGSVTFLDGTATLGMGTLADGVVTFATSSLAAGTHSLTASYAGNASFAASTSPVVSEVVDNPIGAAPTATALSASPNPSIVGDVVTLTATVTSTGGTPAGSVTFLDDAATLGTVTLDGSGVATFASSTLAAGTHGFTASYIGNPSYAASTSPAVSEVVNASILKNPSLETATGSIPTCWTLGSFGTNNVAWARTSDAHNGSYAEQITVSSYTSGAARLVPTQDSGTCAPPGTPGKTYTVSGWYKSSAQPRWVSWYRSSAGVWTWWAQSPLLSAASTWTQSAFTTPALPAGATSVSFGLSLYSTGSLTVDDFSLTAN